MEKKPSKPKDFVERQWDDYTEGDYDENGFFVTPNGSFWDPDGVYFNKDGFDKHGGYYDDNNEYVPGEGWDEANNCYLDEINDYYDDDEYGSDHDEEEDDGFGDIDINNIQDEEELLMKNMEGVEREKYDPNKYVSNFEKASDLLFFIAFDKYSQYFFVKSILFNDKAIIDLERTHPVVGIKPPSIKEANDPIITFNLSFDSNLKGLK